jgi:hypothetical protein
MKLVAPGQWSTLKKALAMLVRITRANPDIAPQAARTYWLQRLTGCQRGSEEEKCNVVFRRAHGTRMEYDDILWPGGGGHLRGGACDASESQELVVLAMLFSHDASLAQTSARCACAITSMLANTENGMVVPAAGGECKLVLNVQDRKGLQAVCGQRSWQRSCAHPLAAFPRSYLLVGPRDKPISDTNYSTLASQTLWTRAMNSPSIGQRPALFTSHRRSPCPGDTRVACHHCHSMVTRQNSAGVHPRRPAHSRLAL